MAPRSVVLIGFMGAGKSAVGAALAEALGFRLFDTDRMVEQDAGRSIPEIWDDEGERGFRELEYRAVVRACAGSGHVIACGGGAILPMRSYGILKGAGPVVFLRAPADVLRARVADGTGRPLLDGDPDAFDRLLAERTPVYESAADLIVDVEGRAPEQIAVEIVERVEAMAR